ncbi:hypothetical protein E6O75_ATG11733 [Venturia nashicola]|uniref:Uncharacterized protein n=1 Tax=Venturia nashicola TaxID=86259 RepID=A0A4Z1P6L9_9PEZI|nr:hypothetical protein E6O75_ATG11733 [Venturia nashicola]
MKPTALCAYLLTFLAMVSAEKHTLCACQGDKGGQLDRPSTIAVCAEMGGVMEHGNRYVGVDHIKFAGVYCRPFNTLYFTGDTFHNACANHLAADSSCPHKGQLQPPYPKGSTLNNNNPSSG